jgi:heme exporter protein A
MASADAATPRLAATGLALERGGRLLFSGLDFALEPGGALIVTGPNGAGKSSLLRLVAGLLSPAAGSLDNPFSTALLGPDLALKRDRTLGSELHHWARVDGAQPADVLAAAEAMAVAPLLGLPVTMLSAGQRQRAAIARMIASGAALWLLDEPTNALDSASEARLLSAVSAHRAGGGLVMAATHQPLGLEGVQRLAIG